MKCTIFVILTVVLISLVLTGCLPDDLFGLGEAAKQKTYQEELQASTLISIEKARADADRARAEAEVDKIRVREDAELERERLRQESMALNARLLQSQEDAASRRFQERIITLGMILNSNSAFVLAIVTGLVVGVFLFARINGYSVRVVPNKRCEQLQDDDPAG